MGFVGGDRERKGACGMVTYGVLMMPELEWMGAAIERNGLGMGHAWIFWAMKMCCGDDDNVLWKMFHVWAVLESMGGYCVVAYGVLMMIELKWVDGGLKV